MLDQWRLDEWLELFVEGARYEVPPAGATDNVDPSSTLFYISDDWGRLQHRVRRLGKNDAHSEFPRSRCVRLIGNVQIVEASETEAQVRSVFVTYRSKGEITDRFMGHHRHLLRRTEQGLRIAFKRSILDMTKLVPQGRVSIIL